MKKITFVLVMLVLTMFGLAVQSYTQDIAGKYADVKALLEKYTHLIQLYIEDCDKATSAAEYAAAIRKYRESLEPIIPEMNAISAKYPEFKNQTEPPEELKVDMEAINKIMENMFKANARLSMYLEDPAVQEENKKLQEVLSKIDSGEKQEAGTGAEEEK